eukprot:1464267-Amphidinium_carterae.2
MGCGLHAVWECMDEVIMGHSPKGQWVLHAFSARALEEDPLLGGSRCFSLGTVNITSLYSYSAELLDFPASLVAVQET